MLVPSQIAVYLGLTGDTVLGWVRLSDERHKALLSTGADGLESVSADDHVSAGHDDSRLCCSTAGPPPYAPPSYGSNMYSKALYNLAAKLLLWSQNHLKFLKA